jgi:hypothetical protein
MSDDSTRANHPVWEFYDFQRDIALNSKYYSARLDQLERANFYIEVSGAAAASSTVASLAWWSTPTGQVIWGIFMAATAVLAIAKPFLKLTEKIRRMEKVLAGYDSIGSEAYSLRIQISHGKSYTAPMQKQFFELVKRRAGLMVQRPEIREHRRIIERCEEQVLREFPAEKFFVPKENEK